jgi:hypothetical protein
MYQLSHKITAFLMAFVVLFSTMSITVSMHFCGDNLIDLSVSGHAAVCENETHSSHCEMESSEMASCQMESMQESNCEMKKDCCTDKEIKIKKSQKDLKNNSLVSVNLKQDIFFIAFVYSYVNQFKSNTRNNNSYYNYHPPPLIKSIYKLDEVYLI